MLRSMSMNYLPRRLDVCGICTLVFLIVLAGCGGSSAPTTNAPSSIRTDTTTVGTTGTHITLSPTSTQPGATPTRAKPSPTTTRAAPTPTATRRTPTPTPTTRSTPTPTPTLKPSPSPTPVPTTMTVTIVSNGGFGFSPQALTITVGITIIWKNNTTAPHTVSSDSGDFDSGTIQPGGTFRFKFTSAGTFAYHCNIHPYMTATITVH